MGLGGVGRGGAGRVAPREVSDPGGGWPGGRAPPHITNPTVIHQVPTLLSTRLLHLPHLTHLHTLRRAVRVYVRRHGTVRIISLSKVFEEKSVEEMFPTCGSDAHVSAGVLSPSGRATGPPPRHTSTPRLFHAPSTVQCIILL